MATAFDKLNPTPWDKIATMQMTQRHAELVSASLP